MLFCSSSRYDLIYDTVDNVQTQQSSYELLKPFSGSTYVRIVSPLMSNNNNYGLVCGLVTSGLQFTQEYLEVVPIILLNHHSLTQSLL